MKKEQPEVSKTRIGKSWSEAVSSLDFVSKSNLALGVAVGALSLMLFFQEPVVVVVPQTIGEDITISGNTVSPSYKQLWAHMVADTMGNVNPNNVEFKIDAIKKIMSPRIRLLNADAMRKHASKMRLTKSEETFSIDNVYYSEIQDLVYVYGPKEIRQKGRKPIVTMWTYEMRIGAKNGKPVIKYIKQYPGSPKNSTNKTYRIEETLFDDVKDLKAMERPLTQAEEKIINAGGQEVVGDLEPKKETKNEK